MTTKLVQKHLLKGTQEFEIVDDAVNIRIKSPFKSEETLTVMLAVLNTEPVIGSSTLDFTSRVNNEALVSLFLAKPNPDEFNAFVNLLKQKIQEEYSAFAGLKANAEPALEGNVYDEPPEFDNEGGAEQVARKPVRVEAVQESIDMLSQYVGEEGIQPVLEALKALREDPENMEHLSRLAKEFDALGPRQGAVLTYAPYIGILLT
jgi:hypothetical protein